MNREKVIVILHYYRDADKAIKMNERVIKNLEDQYYSTLILQSRNFREHTTSTLKRERSTTKRKSRTNWKYEIGSFGGPRGLRVQRAPAFF